MSKRFQSKTSTPFKKVVSGVFRNTRASKTLDSSTDISVEDKVETTVIANPEKVKKVPANSIKMSKSKFDFRDLIQMIRPFDGTKASYKHFVQDVERTLNLADAKTAELLLHYVISIISSLRLDFVLVHSKGSWKDLKLVLDEHFGKKLNSSDIINEITQIKRGTETLFEYYNKFTILLSEYSESILNQYADPVVTMHIYKHAEKIALDSFIKGLNVELKATVLVKDPQNLQDAYKLSRHFEEKLKISPSDTVNLANT